MALVRLVVLLIACVVFIGRIDRAGAQTPRAAATVDLTGYWVSVITTEWRYRMMTPPKGDYEGIPLTAAARKVADAWDPKKETSADACRAYGAPSIMHIPSHVHITWADDATLRVDVDEGTQTRLFTFAPAAPTRTRTWQGQSLADWQLTRPTTGAGPPSAFAKPSSLKVTTSGFRAGYLRRNGVPYSEHATLTEFFDVVPGTRGESWLIVTTKIEDPLYLQQPLIRSVQFRKQMDGAGWKPTACSSAW
jgi:hypothetical protein